LAHPPIAGRFPASAGRFLTEVEAMRFLLLDAIQSYEPGVELTAIKNVALSEEYLADHFPEFPVLPGVFMLEAATQAAAWLLRLSENFAHSIICLKEARNIKYADFVPPGYTLKVTVSLIKREERLATFKVEGQLGDRPTLSGRIVLETYNLRERNPEKLVIDRKLETKFRKTLAALMPAKIAEKAS
jgi:3-hydroxyacyl-[acyl-carrier-protein] dehydratase